MKTYTLNTQRIMEVENNKECEKSVFWVDVLRWVENLKELPQFFTQYQVKECMAEAFKFLPDDWEEFFNDYWTIFLGEGILLKK